MKEYNNKYAKITDVDGNVYIGMCHYEDADTAEEAEDVLVIAVENKDGVVEYIERLESEIKTAELIGK